MPCAAFLIAQEIKQGVPNQDEKQIEALIAGLEARQRGINLSSEDLNVFSRLIEKERLFLSQKNLTASEH
ncbi:MAG: phage infection protein, partial [Parachlamydia sp.]